MMPQNIHLSEDDERLLDQIHAEVAAEMAAEAAERAVRRKKPKVARRAAPQLSGQVDQSQQ